MWCIRIILSLLLVTGMLPQLRKKEDWYLLSLPSTRGFGIVTPLPCSRWDGIGSLHLLVNASSFREYEAYVPLHRLKILVKNCWYKRSYSTYYNTNNSCVTSFFFFFCSFTYWVMALELIMFWVLYPHRNHKHLWEDADTPVTASCGW